MFVQDDSAPPTRLADRMGPVYDSGIPAMHRRIQEQEEALAYLRTRERYLERLSVAALNALMAVDLDAFNELAKRVEDWT